MRASRSARVIRPCSAWCANAAALTRSHSASSCPGRNGRATSPSGRTGSSAGPPRRTGGPGRTARGPPPARARPRTRRRREVPVRPDPRPGPASGRAAPTPPPADGATGRPPARRTGLPLVDLEVARRGRPSAYARWCSTGRPERPRAASSDCSDIGASPRPAPAPRRRGRGRRTAAPSVSRAVRTAATSRGDSTTCTAEVHEVETRNRAYHGVLALACTVSGYPLSTGSAPPSSTARENYVVRITTAPADPPARRRCRGRLRPCGGRRHERDLRSGQRPIIDIQILSFNDFHGNLEPPTGSSGRLSSTGHAPERRAACP